MKALALSIMTLCAAVNLPAQNQDIETSIRTGELQMTFPSIYFRHNSTDYAAMPYTADSCFKFIAANIQELHSCNIWRDSSETEQLTGKRIKKLREELNRYSPGAKIAIKPVRNGQKLSQRTIGKSRNNEQAEYLLALNSVLDVSGAIHPQKKWRRRTHYEGRYLCFGCWKRGAFTREYQRLHGRKKKE